MLKKHSRLSQTLVTLVTIFLLTLINDWWQKMRSNQSQAGEDMRRVQCRNNAMFVTTYKLIYIYRYMRIL